MTNPTTQVTQFDGSAAGWSITGPERYSNGLWLEQAATNLIYNPSVEVDTTRLQVSAGFSLSQDTAHASAGAYAAKVTTDGGATKRLVNQTPTGLALTGVSQPYIGAIDLFGTPGAQVRVDVSLVYTDTSQELVTGTLCTLAEDTPQRVISPVVTANPAKTIDQIVISARAVTASVFDFWADAMQIEASAYPTSYLDGAQGSGYGWGATAHNSTSTRAASSASISPAGILSPDTGSLAFRVTPTIETGVEEIWGECGVKGAGTDHLRWGRDASTHPFVEWSSNDAAYQRLTGSETLDALTAYDLYFGHTGTVTSLAVDAGTLQTGTRAAVSGDFSTGDLTLESSAGGVIYQPFATFNRTLTAKEIATLNGKNNWTMKVLAGNPYINFQLRPY